MVFGLFSKERARKRAIAKTTNKLAQSPDRYVAMEKLRDDASEEALYGLCRRFSITSSKLIEDQEEKEWVVQTLASLGAMALPPLRRYMKNASSVAYPLRVVSAVCNRDQAFEVIDELLERERPGYTREPEKRIQVLNWLSESEQASDEEVIERVMPYLEDFDENVRFSVTEILARRYTPAATEALVRALTREEEESLRLKVRIADVLVEHQADLKPHKDAIAPLLDSELRDFKLHRDKLVRKKK